MKTWFEGIILLGRSLQEELGLFYEDVGLFVGLVSLVHREGKLVEEDYTSKNLLDDYKRVYETLLPGASELVGKRLIEGISFASSKRMRDGVLIGESVNKIIQEFAILLDDLSFDWLTMIDKSFDIMAYQEELEADRIYNLVQNVFYLLSPEDYPYNPTDFEREFGGFLYTEQLLDVDAIYLPHLKGGGLARRYLQEGYDVWGVAENPRDLTLSFINSLLVGGRSLFSLPNGDFEKSLSLVDYSFLGDLGNRGTFRYLLADSYYKFRYPQTFARSFVWPRFGRNYRYGYTNSELVSMHEVAGRMSRGGLLLAYVPNDFIKEEHPFRKGFLFEHTIECVVKLRSDGMYGQYLPQRDGLSAALDDFTKGAGRCLVICRVAIPQADKKVRIIDYRDDGYIRVASAVLEADLLVGGQRVFDRQEWFREQLKATNGDCVDMFALYDWLLES